MRKPVDYSLYLVTDQDLMSTSTLAEAVEQAILGGCTLIQLREKGQATLDFYQTAIEVKTITDRYGVPLIINDRIDIALAVKADGVHIGQSDIPAAITRQLIGHDMILGVSVGCVGEARKAMADGADYLGVGAMFPTGTKEDAKLVTMDELSRIRKAVAIPMIVIGGINRGNAAVFAALGVDGLAVVSAIIAQPDITKAAAGMKQAFQEGKPMQFKAAIFDLDGTLLDSMDIWEKIDIAFLSKRGLPVPENYVTEICARSFAEAARYTIDLFELSESANDIIDEWNRMAEYEYTCNVHLQPHAKDYLLKLKAAGIKLAVATALPEKLYKPCLVNNGVYELFDVLCSTDEVGKGKEDPAIFLLTSTRLGIPPQKCIVFEDVLPAVKSAKQAGMIVYGVYDKYSAHHMNAIKGIADGYILDFGSAPSME